MQSSWYCFHVQNFQAAGITPYTKVKDEKKRTEEKRKGLNVVGVKLTRYGM